MSESPVGRLAPSPTGLLHLGHARSFLLAWWSSRSRGGRVVLRVEDLDPQRSRQEYVEACLRDMEWLGLDWDGEPLFQSSDPEPYLEACQTLLDQGAAYHCVCTRAEIASAAAPHRGDSELRYPGTCRDRVIDETGPLVGLRVQAPAGPIEVHDRLYGSPSFDIDATVGDFMIKRRDGVIAYQLAVVVDDARQGVTEVLRGADLLSSAARQQHLGSLLSLPTPAWFHVPLVVDAQGERLAKRRGSSSLEALREGGIDPRQVVAWAATSAGQPCPSHATAEEVARTFDPDRMTTSEHVLPEGSFTTSR